MIPNIKEFIFRKFTFPLTEEEKQIAIEGRINFQHEDYLDSITEFAIEILKYNLKQYRTQILQFNTGEAGKLKSYDQITLETIKELEND